MVWMLAREADCEVWEGASSSSPPVELRPTDLLYKIYLCYISTGYLNEYLPRVLGDKRVQSLAYAPVIQGCYLSDYITERISSRRGSGRGHDPAIIS